MLFIVELLVNISVDIKTIELSYVMFGLGIEVRVFSSDVSEHLCILSIQVGEVHICLNVLPSSSGNML